MHDKSYNAPELIQKDLICFLGFSRRGVELVGDLDERMGKTEMMKVMEEEARNLAAAGLSKKASKKRKVSTPAEKEARREKRKKKDASTSRARPEETIERGRASPPPTQMTEECPKPPPTITSSPVRKGPGRVHPLDYAEGSLVAYPSGVVATRQWLGGEVVKRVTRAHRTVKETSRSFDEAMGQHAEVLAWLEELEALRAREQRAAEAREEALKAEKEARAVEKEAMGKDDFLKSVKFDALCAKKAWVYFKHGFSGCLAQFQANGYPEEEHPASFLDVKQALADMDDQAEAEEGEEEEEEEEGDTDASPPSSPQP
ncbi:TSL-kinase interacting protein 1-like [Dorcoceras hygrometricum]|uniref:TSL-kinase interacting protein 1-like n=1 Tax=Dorcoceras hygrometricum TaxID=472368 RepID=A0A2Z7B5D1_9LAMI|nr:TSL-kinase interacting protein 1-like [Dorcoceras hygrometricum]